MSDVQPRHFRSLPNLLPALGLLVITLVAFAIVSPLNRAVSDDWIYPFYARLQTLTVLGSNRQFGILPPVVTEILTPGRVIYGMFTVQVLSVFGTGLSLFYLIRRLLSGYAWFALLIAVVYLLYIPNNVDQARSLYSASVYTWVVFLGSAAAFLLVEHHFHTGWRRWLGITLGSICAYISIRAIESIIPVLVCLPLLFIFKRRDLKFKRLLVALLIWYGMVGIGVFQFFQPFLSKSSQTVYQNQFASEQKSGVVGVLTDTLNFYPKGFPIQKFIDLPAEGKGYLLPGVMLGLACVVTVTLFRRKHSSARYLPPPSVLFTLIAVGLIEIGLGVVTFAYAGIIDRPRVNFFAAPGQALVFVGAVGLIAFAVEKLLVIRPVHFLTGFLFLYGILGASWYADAQQNALDVTQGQQFSDSVRFFREIAALVPNAKPDTLVLYRCKQNTNYRWRSMEAMAGFYLYDGVRIGSYAEATYMADQVNYKFVPWLDPGAAYGYDQVIMIGCAPTHLYIETSFPKNLLPAGVRDVDYNPFARLVNGFIPPQRGHMLGY